MSSVNGSDGGNPSNRLQLSNGRSMTNGQARVLTRLANCGKNDSVKSTYSLSVFLDPDASKDMVRQEELWYPMEDPSSADNQGLDGATTQGLRTVTVSAGGSRMLMTQERKDAEASTFVSKQMADYGRNKEQLMRNGSRSTTSSTVASTSARKGSRSGNESGTDMESYFNRNTAVMGIHPGDGERGGGGRGRGEEEGEGGGCTDVRGGAVTREELGYGVRRWSTEGNLQRASKTRDTEEDEYGGGVVEQGEVYQVRSQTGALSKASPPGHGFGTSSDSAADEDAVGYSTGIKEKSDFRHVRDASGTASGENGDQYSSDTHVKQGTPQVLRTSHSSTEEDDEDEGDYQNVTQERNSFGDRNRDGSRISHSAAGGEDVDGYQVAQQGRRSYGERNRGASSDSNSAADEDEAAAVGYSSTMQPRTSFGHSRSRAEPTSFTDDGRSSNVANYDGSPTRMAQGRNEFDEEEELTLTEGSDDGETERSYRHREPVRTRSRLSRAMHAVDGGYRGIDGGQAYRNGVNEMTSVPRNSSAVHSEGELSHDYQGRRNIFGAGREGIRRGTTQSEDETGRFVSTQNSQVYRGGPNVRRLNQEVSSEDEKNNWNHSGGTTNRRNDPGTSTYNNQSRTQDGSSEGELEGMLHNGRQTTPVVKITTPSSSSYAERGRTSQQSTSDEDVVRMDARSSNSRQQVVPASRGRNSAAVGASNGARNTTTASLSLTSEEEEVGPQRNRPGLVSNSSRPHDVGQYQPQPAERKTLTGADSLSSNGYSSPREPYSPNNYLPRATNTRGRGNTDTDSVSASDDSRRLNAKGNAPARRVYRDKGYSTYAISPDVQPRSGTSPHTGPFSDRSNGSSLSNLRQLQQQKATSSGGNQTMSYSDDESDADYYKDTQSQQQVVLDFPSEPEDLERTGSSKRKTTVKKTMTTPATGVVRVTPQPPPSSEVARETTTKILKTTPVFGVVSIPEAEPRQALVVAPPERNRTPVVGLISVSRSPSPSRTKTPVVGLISVSRSPSPQRMKTPVVGLISVPPSSQSHSTVHTARTHQPINGHVSVSNSNQILRRSTTPSGHLIPDVNNNINAYPGKFRTDPFVRTVIETVALPSPETQTEIVGIDPELRRAMKTGSNQYKITMNVRPVVGDSSELAYEVYDTAIGRATPVPLDRLRVNGSRTDWGYSEGVDGSYFRPPSAPIGTLRSRQSSVRTPNSQLGFVGRSNGHGGSSMYSSHSLGRIVTPDGRQIYNPPRGSSVGTMERTRSLSRQGPQYLRNTLLQVPPLLQTVTSRPRRLSSDAGFPQHNQRFLDGGGRSRQKRLSSTMSSVFLSPTVERRCNLTNGPSSFRDNTYYGEGRFY